MSANPIGHNSADIDVRIEVRMFNSLWRYGGEEGHVRKLALAAGSDVNDVLKHLKIPKQDVFLVFVNGRDITPEVLPKLGNARTSYVIEEGDVLALSGPVPYSWGYGAPIV